MNGYIKLFRKMTEWDWYKDTNTKALFLHLLIRANFSAQKFRGRFIDKGQLVTTVRNLADETGLTVREVRTALEHLKTTHEIKVDATNKFTIITVENWRFYQVDDGDIDTVLTNPFDKQPTQI